MAKTTIVETFRTGDDEPERGFVTFALATAAQHDDDAIVTRSPVKVLLDSEGAMSVDLQPTSGADADWSVENLSYRVQEVMLDSRGNPRPKRTYYIDVPTSATDVRLGDLATYATAPEIITSVGAELASHTASTTDVHGIADTSALATGADIAAHSDDTTGVHGIADTSALLTQAAANATYAPVPDATPPGSPSVGQVWTSSALVDARVSAAVGDRNVLLSSSFGAIQEPSVWADATHFRMMVTEAGGQCLRSCPLASDPLVPDNWTRHVGTGTNGEVIGANAGGQAGLVNHAFVYLDGSTLWCFGNVPATKTVGVWTAALSDPTTWTLVGTALSMAQLPAGANAWGNPGIIKHDGTWYMLIEYFDAGATNVFQLTWATAPAASGPWTMTTGTALDSFHVGTGTYRFNGASGAQIFHENGQFVVFYHSDNSNGLSAIFRATAPSLNADNWTVLDQPASNGNTISPWIKPVGVYEVDQVADICIFTAPSGQRYAFWSAVDNRTTTFRIMAQPLLPTRKRWDGHRWYPLDAATDTSRGIGVPGKVYSKALTSNFSGSSTTWAQFINALWAPVGTEVDVTLTAVVTAGLTGVYTFEARCWYAPTSQATKAMGGVHLVAGEPTAIRLCAQLSKVVPNLYQTFYIWYRAPTGGTLHCRPVAQAGIEVATMQLTDIAYHAI